MIESFKFTLNGPVETTKTAESWTFSPPPGGGTVSVNGVSFHVKHFSGCPFCSYRIRSKLDEALRR